SLQKIHERLQNVYIDHLDFLRCIKNWDTPDTFFFMDPPYRDTVTANRIQF
ncbi:DNA adenine methylase, partial [Candidatus Bathyarchaeota archaeon]|nr:DNA adenine methylase [Desulfobacterales bacterium]NIU81706.1 DNA adenine methylase [Candidatus Bathyarchaeota archaeon]NIV68354.1 DNA adenine methylase [Candidatus Bathyarchaeota archaeon]